MKKLIIIFLALQFLTNHEAFAEMVKVPFIFQHYQETTSGEDFLDFLKEHYADSDHSDRDHEHGKLPFRHADDGCSNHPSPNISPVVECKNQLEIRLHSSILHQFIITGEQMASSFSGSIWQPPKQA